MDRSLLDTDILSEVTKAKDSRVVANAPQYLSEHGQFAFSAVTVMETVRGYLTNRSEKLADFVAGLGAHIVLPFTLATAELAGRIDADLQRRGWPIGRADPMIAATAIEARLVLVTGNEEHFARIREAGYELMIENWRSG